MHCKGNRNMQKHDINGLTSVESPQCIERHLCACSDWMQHLPVMTAPSGSMPCTQWALLRIRRTCGWTSVCGGGGLPLCADLHQRITSDTLLLKVLWVTQKHCYLPLPSPSCPNQSIHTSYSHVRIVIYLLTSPHWVIFSVTLSLNNVILSLSSFAASLNDVTLSPNYITCHPVIHCITISLSRRSTISFSLWGCMVLPTRASLSIGRCTRTSSQ